MSRLGWWWQRMTQQPGERPYTQAEADAADCFRCAAPAGFQWQVCADGNTWRPLCLACDLELNRLTLDWMGHPHADELMAAYIAAAAARPRHIRRRRVVVHRKAKRG